MITPTEKKEEVNSFFVDSFLNESMGLKPKIEEKSGKLKRRREKEAKKVVEEKEDPKKQQRLIKNRESAQASRERKKIYLKDLEKTVDSLKMNNKDLSSKINSLEEENNRLREQLLRASKGEKISELPPPKKQKMTQQKLPLPSYQQMPFLHPTYWLQMFKGTQEQQQQQFQNNGPKVVLFVALFCVALFLVKSPNDKEMEVNHQRIGRILQQVNTEQNTEMKNVQQLFETLSDETLRETKIQETLGKIKIKWNKESENVTFVFPNKVGESDSSSEISISKKLFTDICETMEKECK